MKKTSFTTQYSLKQLSTQAKPDIEELLGATIELVNINHKTRVQTSFGRFMFHSFAIYDGINAVMLLYQHNKKLALFYILLFILFAKCGFEKDKQEKLARQQFRESQKQLLSLVQILKSPDTPQDTIHDIIKIYREHVPTFDNVTPESVQAALQQIIRQYQK